MKSESDVFIGLYYKNNWPFQTPGETDRHTVNIISYRIKRAFSVYRFMYRRIYFLLLHFYSASQRNVNKTHRSGRRKMPDTRTEYDYQHKLFIEIHERERAKKKRKIHTHLEYRTARELSEFAVKS